MEMIADRVLATREQGWEWEAEGSRVRRCMSIAALGGATLDNEENYLIKKLLTALGIIQVENQARCATARPSSASARRSGAVPRARCPETWSTPT